VTLTSAKKRTKLWIHGSSGRMGKEIQQAIIEQLPYFVLEGGSSRVFEGETFHQGKPVTTEKLAHAIDRVDIVMDFSTPEGNELLLEAFLKSKLKKKAIFIGTTGITSDQLLRWKSCREANGHRILLAQNTSLGVLTTLRLAMQSAQILLPRGYEFEIVETHHNQKIDAPSGTALLLAESIAKCSKDLKITKNRTKKRQPNELGIHSVRGGQVFGEHEIRIFGPDEEIRITHRANSRGLFAKGALVLGQWLVEQGPGFYELSDVKL
jgi:4-hydroxy-tetrahydrodipicolinate reductase